MKLTPLDIHHKEFRVALRGYNQEEVDAFLDEVADEFERLFKENIDLSEKLDAANEKVRGYVEMEKTLHSTMLAAQQSAEETKGKAVKESELLLRDAEIKAKELVQGALAQKQKTQAEFLRIKQVEDEFRMAFRSVLEEHMRKLHAIPVADDVASMVGIGSTSAAMDLEAAGAVEPQPAPAEQAAAAPVAPEVAAPERRAEVATDASAGDEPGEQRPTLQSYADALASAGGPGDEPEGRPRAQLRRPVDGPAGSAAQDFEPPQAGYVQSISLGEVAAPEIEPDLPVFEDPTDFRPGRFAVGEREDDVDIEEID